MFTLFSGLVAVACALASVRRLMWAVAPTSLDAATLNAELDRGGALAWPTLRDAVLERDDGGWVRDLFGALSEADEATRAAFVNEQLTELDWQAGRWGRVPRVCASIATSSGLLFGCIALLRSVGVSGSESPGSGQGGLALVAALDALAVGIAGTSFCAAVHVRAGQALKERTAAINRLVSRLTALTTPPPRAHL